MLKRLAYLFLIGSISFFAPVKVKEAKADIIPDIWLSYIGVGTTDIYWTAPVVVIGCSSNAFTKVYYYYWRKTGDNYFLSSYQGFVFADEFGHFQIDSPARMGVDEWMVTISIYSTSNPWADYMCFTIIPPIE